MLGRETSRIEAVETVLRLVSEARDLDEAGGDKLDEVAEMLQNRRAFGLLLVLCLLASRGGEQTAKLKQREIQALIELGRLDDAVRAARQLASATEHADPADADDIGDYNLWSAAQGNLGRAMKQAYMDAAAACGAATGSAIHAANGSPRAPDPLDLEAAVRAYRAVWDKVTRRADGLAQTPDVARPEVFKQQINKARHSATYTAVNAAALIMRSVRDREAGLLADDADWADALPARHLAEAILDEHEDDLIEAFDPKAGPGDIWALATCGEAHLVIGAPSDAALCYGAFAGHPQVEAFQLASARRQLEEVWQFEGEANTTQGSIVRLLKAALLNLEHREGSVTDEVPGENVTLSPVEADLIGRDIAAAKRDSRSR